MELITPDFGYFFWMVIAFGIVFFCLAKFAFPVIGKALKTREQKISEALEQAERTHEEMKNLQAKNEEMLKQAKEERENMLSKPANTVTKSLKKPRKRRKMRQTDSWNRQKRPSRTNARRR